MTRIILLFVAAFGTLIGLASSAQLSEIITIDSSCNQYMGVLNAWHREGSLALKNTYTAMDSHYNQKTRLGRKVRASLLSWFKFKGTFTEGAKKLPSGLKEFRDDIFVVSRWFDGTLEGRDKDISFLFCGTDFLVQKSPTDPLQDYKGKNIKVDNTQLQVKDMPAYKTGTKGGNVPWWSGDRTVVKAYWYEPPNSGGNYCAEKKLGMTVDVRALEQKAPNAKPTTKFMRAIIICPEAFTHSAPDTFSGKAATLKPGDTLHSAMPKSATLIHEVFHLIFGGNFHSGKKEAYGFSECIDAAAESGPFARANAENYAYFASAMHYMFQDDLPQKWDFCENPKIGRKFDPNGND